MIHALTLPEASTVDVNGCVIEQTQETEEDEEATSAFESFFSGEGDTVTTTLELVRFCCVVYVASNQCSSSIASRCFPMGASFA